MFLLALWLGCANEPEHVSTEPATAEPLAEAIRANSDELARCYEARLVERPALSGRVELGWTVSGGAARDVHVVSDTTGDASLTTCMTAAIGGWSFPAGVDGEVTWPFVFEAAG